jgi:hypothetical protein
MKAKLIFTLFSVVTANFSQAGVIIGNGGKVVVCNPTSDHTAEALDVYQTDLSQKLKANNIDSLDQILDRISSFNLSLAKRLKYHLSNIEQTVQITDAAFNVFGDDNIVQQGCVVKIAMLQLLDTDQTSFMYLRDKDLWEGMDNLQRAIVLLHEAIYSELIISGKSSASVVRNLTKHLLEASINGTRLNSHILELRSSGLLRTQTQLLKLSRTVSGAERSRFFSGLSKQGNYISFFRSPDLASCRFQIVINGSDVNQNSFEKVVPDNELVVAGARYYWALPNLLGFSIKSLSFVVDESNECKDAFLDSLSFF